jgi:hypothetical protein
MTRKIVYGFLACLLALCTAPWWVPVSARFIVDRILTCPAPCRWDSQKGCEDGSPLEAHLEIKTTPDPQGHGEAVWYRATVKNDSCEVFELIPTSYFIAENALIPYSDRDEGIFILVTDAEGKRLPAASHESNLPGIFDWEKVIHPYALDTIALKPLIKRFGERGLDYEAIVLPPGTSIAASPSVLAPFRIVMRDGHNKEMDYTYDVHEPVGMKDPEKHYAVPPPGFRRLTEYTITRSGTYTAQFIFNMEVGHDFDGSTFWRGLRRQLYSLASPSPRDHTGLLKIDTASEKIKFEVSR